MKYFLFFTIFIISTYTQAQCDKVAEVFNTPICQSELAPSADELYVPKPKDNADKINREKQRLGTLIKKIAAEHLLKKVDYTPTNQEIDSYIAYINAAKSAYPHETEDLIFTLKSLLATYKYNSANLKKLNESLENYTKALALDKKIAKQMKASKEKMLKEQGEDAIKKLDAQIRAQHKNWVARWKMNKALFLHYGGRVIFQQAGVEPIDAFSDFYNDIKTKGELKIIKKSYQDLFVRFENYLAQKHRYISDDQSQHLLTPYWQTNAHEKNHLRAIEDLKNIPHL